MVCHVQADVHWRGYTVWIQPSIWKI